MIPYENYLSQMKRLKASLPYMSEKDFCEANGLKYGDDEIAPLVIVLKEDKHKKSASLETFIKNAESTKRKKSIRIGETPPKKTNGVRPPKMSDEERSLKRKEYAKVKKQKNLEMGLTSKGKERKPRPEGMTAKEMATYKIEKMREQRAIWKEQGLNNKGKPFAKDDKEKRLQYAKKYQATHREQHLEYRKKWREENKKKANLCKKEI